jgi:hypothetical protein
MDADLKAYNHEGHEGHEEKVRQPGIAARRYPGSRDDAVIASLD